MENFYERKNINDYTVELTIAIPKDKYRTMYQKLLGEQLMQADVKGFRKGKVPASMVEPTIGTSLRFDAFEKLAVQYIETAVEKESIKPIAPVEYTSVPDMDKEEDLKFTVEVTIMPEFTLGDLKKIKIKREKVKISNDEVESAVQDLFKNNKTKEKEANDKWAAEMGKTAKIKEIKDLASLKNYVKETLEHQKMHALEHEQEDDALNQAIKLSKIEIPEKAIDYEARSREVSFNEDMQKRGGNVDEFLKAYNITMDKMREGWKKDAKEALETDVLLKLYAKERGLKIEKKELDERIEAIRKEAPKDTDSSIYDDESWIKYVNSVMYKEKAYKEFIKEVLGK